VAVAGSPVHIILIPLGIIILLLWFNSRALRKAEAAKQARINELAKKGRTFEDFLRILKE
jgi:preprotein translocase subunit YajC